jgi:hypothetical protein
VDGILIAGRDDTSVLNEDVIPTWALLAAHREMDLRFVMEDGHVLAVGLGGVVEFRLETEEGPQVLEEAPGDGWARQQVAAAALRKLGSPFLGWMYVCLEAVPDGLACEWVRPAGAVRLHHQCAEETVQVGVLLRGAEVARVADVEDTFVRAVPGVGDPFAKAHQARRVASDGATVAPNVMTVQGDVHTDVSVAYFVAKVDHDRVVQVAAEHKRPDKRVQLEEAAAEEFLEVDRRDGPSELLTVGDQGFLVFWMTRQV